MGFSVSGSMVVVLFGLFIALSTFYTSGANTMERLAGAESDRADALDRTYETGVNVTAVTVTDATNCDVEVRVNNTGTTALSLAETSLVVNNTVFGGWDGDATVDGDGDTDRWLPGEQVVYADQNREAAPDLVKVVTTTGVASVRHTEDLIC